VRRPWVEVGFGIVVRALVLVLDKQADWSSKGDSMLDTRLKLDEIFFVTLEGGMRRLDRVSSGYLPAS